MNLPQNPAEAQAALLKRSKELDAQQEYLKSIQDTLDNAPMTMGVYEAQIKAKREQLDELQDRIDTNERRLRDLEIKSNDEVLRFERLTKEHLDRSAGFISEEREVSNKILALKTDLKGLISEIAERERYQKDQERQINETISAGNEEILSLQGRIARINNETNSLANQKLDLQSEVDDLIIHTGTLQDDYEVKIDGLEQELRALEIKRDKIAEEVITETSRYKGIEADATNKLALLKEKETSVLAKQDALQLERQQLDQDKRRWQNSKQTLYGENV